MRRAAVLVAISAALVASALPARAAFSTYQKVAVYDAGRSSVGAIEVDGRSLYAISGTKGNIGVRLSRFDLDTADRIWRLPLTCATWGPEVLGKVVLVQVDGCSASSPLPITAYRTSDGERAFETNASGGVVDGRTAYLTQGGGVHDDPSILWAIAPSGRVRWQYGPFPFDLHPVRTLAAGDGAVFVQDGHDLVALSARGGHELWRQGFGDVSFFGSVEADGVFVLTVGIATPTHLTLGTIAFNATGGDLLWSASDAWIGDVEGGVAYLNEGDVLRARAASDGSVLWTAPNPGATLDSPLVDAGVVWMPFVDAAGSVGQLALDASDGSVLGSEPWPRILGFANGVVYVPRSSGRIVAFAPTA